MEILLFLNGHFVKVQRLCRQSFFVQNKKSLDIVAQGVHNFIKPFHYYQ